MKRIIISLFFMLIMAASVFSDPTDAQIRQAASTLGVPFEDLRQFVHSYKYMSSNDNSSKSIDNLLEYFSKEFSVSDKIEMWFQMIGAIDGCVATLNGSSIEIYKFDNNDLGQKTILENAQKTHTLSVLGMTMPVLINGTFIIVNYADHPEKKKLIEAFEKF
jgi:hypothetical protein